MSDSDPESAAAARAAAWNPPADWARFTTIDAHAAGEPLRVVTGGLAPIPGGTMLQKRRWARGHVDDLRRLLMWEPRGHADMYGALPTEPVTPDGDLGVLFLHNEGFSTMCGHGVIALVSVAFTCGFPRLADPQRVALDTPAGRVTARARLKQGRVERVEFENVPSFVLEHGQALDVPELGRVSFDLAFGGAFYAFVDAAAAGLELVPEQAARVIAAGRRVSSAVREALEVRHPAGHEDLGFLYGTIFTAPARAGGHSRHACVFADGELDRSPTGTGVSARAALLSARGELEDDAPISIESLIGTSFDVRVRAHTDVAGVPAVVPEVGGAAHVTGRHEFWLDPRDPLARGFLLG